ncbi:hypothetical protein BAZ10_08105 [Elizabethkingia occulta]|uniref:Uncharacterized protein n=2 Tax=Elizabethkingia TaxID=308865 RepID=A0ABX3NDT8_9FLAO|nr:hypothetical protein BB020_07085 [Elizabethkingia occulta]OPB89221.1 hypothetical protein BB021_07655 [Elizabethkingia ursingii]OPC61833.1 hypothetical protein BAZ10_08105 [Elizabethkingia occulta]
MKKILNNKYFWLSMTALFVLLFIAKTSNLIAYGFQFHTIESNAFNTGLFTGKIFTLISFLILSYSFYKKYLYLGRNNIK